MKDILLKIFEEMNTRIEAENAERELSGTPKLRPIEVKVFGQATLLANEMVAQVLSLQMTNDLDAQVENDQAFAKGILRREILPKYGLVLDDDSHLVWLPPRSKFELFCNYRYVKAVLLDPESTLVSKAVKAREKNKVLIIDAIASGIFPNLVERIEENNGDLNYFLEN